MFSKRHNLRRPITRKASEIMKKLRVLAICCFVLCSIVSAIAQVNLETDENSVKVPVKDVSDSDSPLRISGEWRFKMAKSGNVEKLYYQEHTIATNVSGHKIIAYVVSIRVVGPMGPLADEDLSIDAFFQHTHELAPGQRFDARERCASELSGDAPGSFFSASVPEPHVDAKVIFVQFDGGTTYGDVQNQLASDFIQHRANTLETLQRLVQITDQSQFEGALASKQEDTEADRAIQSLRKVQQHD